MATNYPSPRIRHPRVAEGVRREGAKRSQRKEALKECRSASTDDVKYQRQKWRKSKV